MVVAIMENICSERHDDRERVKGLLAICMMGSSQRLQVATLRLEGKRRCCLKGFQSRVACFRLFENGMRRSVKIKGILLVTATMLGATGCTVHTYTQPGYATADVGVGGEVYVNEPPPAPVSETIVAAPGPGFVWVGGYWGWGGGRWRWEGGHWARPPHAGARWVGPRYYTRSGRHVWVHGEWH